MENRYNMYPSKKTTGVALVISDKSECKEITITRYKEWHFIVVKFYYEVIKYIEERLRSTSMIQEKK